MRRTGGVAWICGLSAALMVAPTIACKKPSTNSPARPSQQAASPQPAAESPLTPDEQSCKAFVQDFYDWYWNQFADRANDPNFDVRRLHSYPDVVRRHPPILSSGLFKLIKRDQRTSEATQSVGVLDFDPFLNTQDPEGKYLVNHVTISNGQCEAEIDHAHLISDLTRSGSTWVFTNFHYSFYSEDGKAKAAPDDDLIDMLSR
jgi:Protein of unknown function (DUF3828)